MLVEKLPPPLGVPGKLPEDYRPGRPSILISRPRWRKKGPQLLPEERIIDDARGWTGRLGVHSKNQLHLVRVG